MQITLQRLQKWPYDKLCEVHAKKRLRHCQEVTVTFATNTYLVVCASGRVVVQSRQLACFVILSRSIRTVRHCMFYCS